MRCAMIRGLILMLVLGCGTHHSEQKAQPSSNGKKADTATNASALADVAASPCGNKCKILRVAALDEFVASFNSVLDYYTRAGNYNEEKSFPWREIGTEGRQRYPLSLYRIAEILAAIKDLDAVVIETISDDLLAEVVSCIPNTEDREMVETHIKTLDWLSKERDRVCSLPLNDPSLPPHLRGSTRSVELKTVLKGVEVKYRYGACSLAISFNPEEEGWQQPRGVAQEQR